MVSFNAPGLTDGSTLYREPHWTRLSPDRKFFLSWATDVCRPGDKFRSSYRFMIYLRRVTGGQTRTIAPDGEEQFAWSPDSRQFAYSIQSVKNARSPIGIAGKLPSAQVVVVGVDGSNEKVVLKHPVTWKSTTGHLTAGNCSSSSGQPSLGNMGRETCSNWAW